MKLLDQLADALPAFKLLNFKFKEDKEHDIRLLDWFADGGELRAYKNYKFNSIWRYNIYLYKKGLKMLIGSISEDIDLTDNNKWKIDYIKYFLGKNNKLSYCTNNILKTREEIQHEGSIVSYTDTLIYYKDGSSRNIFNLSKDTPKSYEKSKLELIKILNKLSELITV